MVRSGLRIVLDTNVLLRGLVNSGSASGKILAAAERGVVVVILSRAVLAEYRAVATSPEVVAKYPELEPERVEIALRRVRYLGQLVRTVRRVFDFPRDPLDEKFVDVSIAGAAGHLVTSDRDLLSLAGGRAEPAKRLRRLMPNLRIVEPREFIGILDVARRD